MPTGKNITCRYTRTAEILVGLSLKRANAVVKALVNEYGIAADRLAGKGAGPLCPIGSNITP